VVFKTNYIVLGTNELNLTVLLLHNTVLLVKSNPLSAISQSYLPVGLKVFNGVKAWSRLLLNYHEKYFLERIRSVCDSDEVAKDISRLFIKITLISSTMIGL